MLKKTCLILTSILLLVSFGACTKKAVRPDTINQAVSESVADTGYSPRSSGSAEGIGLVASAKNLVNDVFSMFGNAKISAKGISFSKSQAITGMIIAGAVLVGLLVLYQNRPKKYAASKGKYQG